MRERSERDGGRAPDLEYIVHNNPRPALHAAVVCVPARRGTKEMISPV